MYGKLVFLFAVICIGVSQQQSCGCTVFTKKIIMTPLGDGPQTAPLPVLQAPSITLPTIETPLVALPSPPVPGPRVLSQKCICTKTVVKPQIFQREVKIPKIQRYLKRSFSPIVENLAYKTRPVPGVRGSTYYASSVC